MWFDIYKVYRKNQTKHICARIDYVMKSSRLDWKSSFISVIQLKL